MGGCDTTAIQVDVAPPVWFDMVKLVPVDDASVTLITLNPGGAVTVAVKVIELELKLSVNVPAFMVHL